VAEYTREEVIWAVRRCGLELACRPTSSTYITWSSTKHRLAREKGMSVRVPTIYAVYRHFPRGGRQRWQRAVTAAALTDEELRAAYARRMRIGEIELTPADELDEATIKALRDAGLTEMSLELIKQGEPGALPLSQAVIAARALDCSLSHLTRTTAERGRPPEEGTHFDFHGWGNGTTSTCLGDRDKLIRFAGQTRRRVTALQDQPPGGYLISVSSLNIGRYIEMITMPTMIPTPSIMIGSTIDVSDWIEASTSSS
jgi:hypothetical protein